MKAKKRSRPGRRLNRTHEALFPLRRPVLLAALGLCGWAPAAAADFPPTLERSSLDGTNGLWLNGAADAAFISAGELAFDRRTLPQSVAVGDFDSDGSQDLAIADFGDDRLYVRLGNGDGTFTDAGGVDGLSRPFDLVVGDFNADGTEDLAVAAGVSPNFDIAVLRGRGDGSFQQLLPIQLQDAVVHSLAVGDFNGDGRDDLAATSFSQVHVRLGNGNGTFAGGVDIPFDPSPASVATGDFDGNGIEDLAVILNAAPARLGILLGKGNGAFDPVKTVGLPNFAQELAVGDFDADGREDLAATIVLEDRVSVRLGNGDGTLSDDAPDVAVGDRPFSVAVGDFDSDGREDLAITNGDSVSVRLGNGDGSFSDGGEVAVGDLPFPLAVGDFDADGKEDLAVGNFSGGTVSLRLGSGAAPLGGNLLVNGSFEQGLGARLPTQSPPIPGWTQSGGMTFVRYGVVPHFGFPSHLDSPRYTTGGLNFLWGGDSFGLGGVTTASQTVDVSGSAEPIDAGNAIANLSAYLGGALFYPDHMSATAEFLSATDASLGALQIGPVTNENRKNLTTLLRRADSAPMPVGTRRVRVTLTSTDADTTSSAMADNVKFTLDTGPSDPSPPPPPPGTCNGLPVTIQGTDQSETLIGTPGKDVIDGQGGNDVIRGLGGNDVLCGGEGRDRLFGGPGRDRLLGGNGRDALNGGTGRDRCDGGRGTDTTRHCEVRVRVP